MKVPLQWVWENDPKRLPDADHRRCIAAPGERFLACGAQLFALTTRPCTYLSGSDGGRSTLSFSTLQIEYLGRDWARGLAQQSWGSEPFDSGSLGGEAQQAAGLTLLATVAGALAGELGHSLLACVTSQVDGDGPGQPLRPPGWPPRGQAARVRRPALLPLTVGRGDDLR